MMRIMFLCSSLESGKDGVGDYTRLLAAELIKQGNQVDIIALNDRHINKVSQEVQQTSGISIDVLRLPFHISSAKRLEYFSNRISHFTPDLISLQYVGFGYHKYGLPINLIRFLRKAKGTSKLHIMFHELWCGMAKHAGVKEKILGYLQKKMIQFLLFSVKPDAVFTSILPYAQYLKKIGAAVKVVPIFGNIPIEQHADFNEKEWNDILVNTGIVSVVEKPDQWFIIGFFGTIYSSEGITKLLKDVIMAANSIDKKPGILFIGHSRKNNVLDLLNQENIHIDYWKTGILPDAMINKVMRLVDVGIITTPVDGINKSGAAIAWMERRIPILISGEDKKYVSGEMIKDGIYQVHSSKDVLKAHESRDSLKSQSRLTNTADSYLTIS